MKKRLKDIADFTMGYQFRGRVTPDPTGKVRVVQIKDIDADLRIRSSGLEAVNLERPEPYLIHQDDVLFLSRGHRQYAILVTEPVKETIATGYFFILRPKASVIQSNFLAWTINQPDFQEAMRPFVRGSHIPMVSKTDFQNITIRVPPLVVQHRIMDFQALLDREKHLSAAIQSKRQQLVQAVSQRLITGKLIIKG